MQEQIQEQEQRQVQNQPEKEVVPDEMNIKTSKKNKNELKIKSLMETLYPIISIVGIIGLIWSYYYLEYKMDYYAGQAFEHVNIYNGFSGSFLLITLTAGGFLIMSFINSIENLKNPINIIKPMQKMIKNRPKIEINEYLYATIIVSLPSLIQYVLIQAILLTSLATSLTFEYNHQTFEKLSHYGYSENYGIVAVILMVTTFFAFSKPKKSMNKMFLLGGLILPIVVSFLFNINLVEFFIPSEMMSTNVKSIILPSLDVANIWIKYLIGALLFLIFLISVLINKQKFSRMSYISKNLRSLATGFIVNKILAVIILTAALTSQQADYFKANLNDRTTVIEGVEYNYRLSLLTHEDSKEDYMREYLIEGYMGESMHNASFHFSYIFSKDYKGDKEKAFKLYSKVYLEYGRKMEKTKGLAKKALKERMELSEAVPILIGLIKYDYEPLYRFKGFYENTIKGDYQAAVDSYINDHLNNTTPLITEMGNTDNPKWSIGSDGFRNLLSSMIQNGYAEVDYSKINNQKFVDDLKTLFEKEIYEGTHSTDEQIEDWYKIFKIE